MGVSSAAVVDAGNYAWQWESSDHPLLTAEQETMLDVTIDEVRRSPLSSAVTKGGRSAVWRYLVAAQWQLEPTQGRRVSWYFVDTLEWRKSQSVDTILDAAQRYAFLPEAKLFVRGKCLRNRPLIWLHLGRENNSADPESNIRFLIYTVVSFERG